MGFWDTLLRRSPPLSVFTPNVTYLGGNDELAAYYGSGRFDLVSPASLWRTQPHLRTVVSFLARNIAQLGVHSFERVSETDRKRDRTSLAARVMASPEGPQGRTTTYDLIYSLVGDVCLYDRAYWWVAPSHETPTGYMIRRLPPSWVSHIPDGPFAIEKYLVATDGRGESVEVPKANILDFTGYSPSNPLHGSPTVESLKDTLAEQREAALYRAQVWKRGGRVSSVLERPKDAPQWSDTARESFREDWYAKFTGRGDKAGGTPILEDGMQLKRIDFSAAEQQFVEAAKLSLTTVAAAYHVNPTMIGQNDGANYSNVREFRRMLYGDTLGPDLSKFEARFNTFLLPMLQVDPERFYLEFNIAEKLQGSFEEQAQALQSSVGGPWMSRAEARARMNLPAIAGAEELIVPLNVLVGGQASPQDSAPPKATAPLVKAAPTSPERTKAEQALTAFFKRQRAAILSALGAKAAADWWDTSRWDSELADDLFKVSALISTEAAKRALEKAGGDPDVYDEALTLAYLKAKAKGAAEGINAVTKAQIEAALDDDDPDVAHVFDVAEGSRSAIAAVTLATSLAAFGTHEAGKQSGAATKTWIVGAKARPSHAAMAGETVAMSENFSNGMAWPGDSSDADEVAGCNCSVEFNYP